MKNKISFALFLAAFVLVASSFVSAGMMTYHNNYGNNDINNRLVLMPPSYSLFEQSFQEFEGSFDFNAVPCIYFCDAALNILPAATGNQNDVKYNCLTKCIYGGRFVDLRPMVEAKHYIF